MRKIPFSVTICPSNISHPLIIACVGRVCVCVLRACFACVFACGVESNAL